MVIAQLLAQSVGVGQKAATESAEWGRTGLSTKERGLASLFRV